MKTLSLLAMNLIVFKCPDFNSMDKRIVLQALLHKEDSTSSSVASDDPILPQLEHRTLLQLGKSVLHPIV